MLWPADVVCMPVLEVGEVLGTEQARVNGYGVEVDDDNTGATMQAGRPSRSTVRVGGARAGRRGSRRPQRAPATGLEPRRVCAPAGEATALPLSMSGLRVVDFGSYVAGPFGSQCLADFGADVIKVEPLAGEKGREINQFTGCQRGKRSIALDLRHPRSREVLEPMVASADVVMHNMRPERARRWASTRPVVRAINPDVVFCHSSGYGPKGRGPTCRRSTHRVRPVGLGPRDLRPRPAAVVAAHVGDGLHHRLGQLRRHRRR